ncbi:MAG: hypothetical protein V7603_2152 [Micromonosporaceae bacterium]|jgi:hypothetical protein
MATVRTLLGRRFNGYRGVRLPHDMDAVVESVVVAYLDAPAATRQETLDAVRPDAAGVLTAYGERMAAMAVRTDSVVPLYRGVVAMGMALSRLDDPRFSVIVLAAVHDSATRLGTSLARILEDARRYLPQPAYDLFQAFTERTARDKSLPAMGLAAYGSKEDFRYGSGPTAA